MNNNRLLSKSRFKIAMECPTKLFYTGKTEYLNKNVDDTFLAALAEGGFQVGELAKCYYPEGHNITSLNLEEAEQQTNALLKLENVVIFEPVIRFNNLVIRVDILVKKNKSFELIEVKAKSYSKSEDNELIGKKGGLTAGWKPYLYDVAFQKHVLQSAFPDHEIDSYLLLVNKESVVRTDGLNQKFLLIQEPGNRKSVKISGSITNDDLSSELLSKVNVDRALELVYTSELPDGMPGNTFIENIEALAKSYEFDEKIAPAIGNKCKKCEFTCTPIDEQNGKLSGFKTCWKESLGWQDKDFEDQTVLNVWDFKGASKIIEKGIVKIKDMSVEYIDIKDRENNEPGLSRTNRQWLQVNKVKENDNNIFFDKDGIKSEMESWTYPLHFIDFETNAMAIPFFKGMNPYENIAFQFSHHILHEDGQVDHAGEFLSTNSGHFPNFDFLRELKRQLEKDDGTIFRYSNHENTILRAIGKQLTSSNEEDKEALCEFIDSITRHKTKGSKVYTYGERCMVDLLDLVKQYYYDPETNGLNSIKAILPSILRRSTYIQQKYGQKVYGTQQIKSHNFKEHQWLTLDENSNILDPYKTLPKMFQGASEHELDLLSEGDELNNGGLALIAYAKLQCTQMSDYERDELKKALLKYCELDTLAMVMIVEAWKDWLNNNPNELSGNSVFINQIKSQNINWKGDMNRSQPINNSNSNFNLLSVLTYGNGTIKEDHISSLIGFLLNPDNDHSLGNKLLISFLDEILDVNSEIRRLLLSQDGRQLWKEMDVVLEYKVCTKGHSQNSRIIDVILKFWKGERKQYPDAIVAIENKIAEGAVQEYQLSEELYGLHNKYSKNNNTLLQFVFLAPKGNTKGDISFEKLEEAIDLLKEEHQITIPARYLPWQSSSEASMKDILNNAKFTLSVEDSTRYAIDCLNGLVEISFNVRNERTELIRGAIFNILKNIDEGFNLEFPLTEGNNRYSFKYNKKRFVAVFFGSFKSGQVEIYSAQPEEMVKKYNGEISDIGLSDYVTVNLPDTKPDYKLDNRSYKNSIWLDFNLNGTQKVINNVEFLDLLEKLILEAFKPLNTEGGTIKNVKTKLTKVNVEKTESTQEIESKLIGLEFVNKEFKFGKSQINTQELLKVPLSNGVFVWEKNAVETYLTFISKLNNISFFNSIEQNISGHQAHNARNRTGKSLNFGKLSRNLLYRIMSIYFPIPDGENNVLLGYQTLANADGTQEFIDAAPLDYTNEEGGLVPIIVIYKELFDECPDDNVFASKITCSAGNDTAYTFALKSKTDVDIIIDYLTRASKKLLRMNPEKANSNKMVRLLKYCQC